MTRHPGSPHSSYGSDAQGSSETPELRLYSEDSLQRDWRRTNGDRRPPSEGRCRSPVEDPTEKTSFYETYGQRLDGRFYGRPRVVVGVTLTLTHSTGDLRTRGVPYLVPGSRRPTHPSPPGSRRDN